MTYRPPRKRNYFFWALAGLTAGFGLQFFVVSALNSYETRFQPRETCPPCKVKPLDGQEGCAFRRTYCFVSPNRTCPECRKSWTAPYHDIGPLMLWIELGLLPLTVVALRLLLRSNPYPTAIASICCSSSGVR
jgi:hypothetical protein